MSGAAGKAPADELVYISSDGSSDDDVKPDMAKLVEEESMTAVIQFNDRPPELFVCREFVVIVANKKDIRVYNNTEEVYAELQEYIRSNHVRCEQRRLPHYSPGSCIKEAKIYANNFLAGLPNALRAKITNGLHMSFELITNKTHRLLRKTEIGGNAVELDVTFEGAFRVDPNRTDIPRHQYRFYKVNPTRELPENDAGPMGIAIRIITEDYVDTACFNNSHLSRSIRLQTGVGNYREFCHPDPKENATTLPKMAREFSQQHPYSTSRALTFFTYMHLQDNKEQLHAFDTQILAGLFTLKERHPGSDDYLWLIAKCLWGACHGPNKRGYEAIKKNYTFDLREAAATQRNAYKQGFYCARPQIALPYAVQAGLYSGFFQDDIKAEGTRIFKLLIFATSVCMISDGGQEAPPNGQLIAVADAADARKAKNLMDLVNRDKTFTFDDVLKQWHAENLSDMRAYYVCIHPEKLLLVGELQFLLCDVVKLNQPKFSGIHPDKLDGNGNYKIGPPIVNEDIDENDGGESSMMAEVKRSTKTVNALAAAADAMGAAASAAASAASAAVVATGLLLNTSGGSSKKPGKSILRHPPPKMPPKMLASKRARDPSNGAAGASSGKYVNRGYVSNGAAAAGSAAPLGSGLQALVGSGTSGKDVVNVYIISTGAAAAGSGAAAANNAVSVNAVSVAGAASSAASYLCPCKTPNCTWKPLFADHAQVAELLIHFASNPPKTQARHQNSQQYQDNRKILVHAFENRLQHTNQIEKLYNRNDRTHKDPDNGSDGKKVLGDNYKYAHEDHNLRVIFTDFKEFVRDNDFLKTEFDKLI
jgi:hypothetical protein